MTNPRTPNNGTFGVWIAIFLGFILALAIITSIAGCGKEEVSWATQESSRQAAIDNAEFNARVFRDANAPQLNIKMRGDSTIGPDCAQGDGWASVDLTNDSGVTVGKIKCSTVSGSIGCLAEEDFKARKAYASQDGRCNADIPFPIPKIAK